MSQFNTLKNKIFSLENLKVQVENWKATGEKIVFTNGCFDIVHQGHIELLAHTADLGTSLIVGLNSDCSIQELKNENRPIIKQQSRAILLASFSFVDAVVLFSEQTPINLISTLLPDVLSKGGDYEIDTVVGHEIVQRNGGRTILIPFVEGFSSTTIIEKIRQA